MHKGVYFGKNFTEQKKKILILGESHHGKEEDKGNSAKYNTCDVVEEYLQAKRGEIKMIRSLYFFTKIAHAFDSSLNCQDTINFWNNVAFGNYIDVICGIKDNYAKSYIYENNNRDRLNKDLFEFVNKNRIDCIICVSKLVFNALPEPPIYSNSSEVSTSQFLSSETYTNNLKLCKNLLVYSIPHPSGFGFKPKKYNEILNCLIIGG